MQSNRTDMNAVTLSFCACFLNKKIGLGRTSDSFQADQILFCWLCWLLIDPAFKMQGVNLEQEGKRLTKENVQQLDSSAIQLCKKGKASKV